MIEYEIKKGIPIPLHGQKGKYVNVLRKMDVGDCFDVPIGDEDVKKIKNRLNASLRGKNVHPLKVMTRHIKNEKVVRIWRIK